MHIKPVHLKAGPHKASVPVVKPVGSGSRPGHSKITIHTSAPKHEHHLGRKGAPR